MTYLLKTITSGMLGNNTYILSCPESLNTVIIDPAFASKEIIEYVLENSLNPCAIINTHGHYDHVTANRTVKEAFNIPVLIHEADAAMIKKDDVYTFDSSHLLEVDRLLKGGEELVFGTLVIKVLHTPGHSPGGICLLCEDALFTGDTLFYHEVGRCDLLGGSLTQLVHSINEKLLILPNETKVYPGHEQATSIGEERWHNPYLKEKV